MSIKKIPSDEILINLYVNEMLSCQKIGKMYGCTKYAVGNRLHRIGVELRVRNPTNNTRKVPQDEILKKLYIQDHLSCQQIGEMYGCTKHAVSNRLKILNIPMRTAQDYEHSHPIGEKNHNWKGGRFISKGYVYINRHKLSRIPEHRAVMENVLGRKLSDDEIVHHLNAVKDDNRPENLFVCTRTSHPLDSKDTYRGALEKRIRDLEDEVKDLKKRLGI